MKKVREKIVSITKKGQATLPLKMRERHGLKRKALVIDTKDGLLIKPVPDPEEEMGSLKGLFKKSAKELLKESRAEDIKREKRMEELS